MATSTMVPLSEYLRTSYDPDREWVDGELKERNLGEYPHASLQKFFMKYFLLREEEFNIRVYAELRVQVSSTNYRLPDVLVLRESDPAERIVRTPPLLCIEVLSREDRLIDMHEKIDDYVAMGVFAIWVIDPERRKGFSVEDGALRPVEELKVAGSSIQIAVSDAFAEMDRLAKKSR